MVLPFALVPMAGLGPASAIHAQSQSITLTEEDYWPAGTFTNEINGLISLYEASHPNVTITRTYVPVGSFTSRILQQAVAHKLPDILILDNPTVQAIASTGALTNISPYTKGWSQLSGYYPSSLSTATWKGNLYGIPVGNNDLALYYNKTMFKKAGIANPPATWADFRADAKKLTTSHVYGFAFSAAKDEEGTWSFEPYFWANGADLQHADSSAAVEALTFLSQVVQDGSASKEVLNWGQGDVVNQFFAGNAAMMEMGTWELSDPLLAAAAAKGNPTGIAYLPRKTASMAPVSPLGGEVWTLPASNSTRENAAWSFVKWTQDPTNIQQFDGTLGYLSAYKTVNKTLTARNPMLKIFAGELPTSRARATVLGPNYPKVSEAIWTAIQSALSGQQSPQSALQTAQSTISAIQ
jgi:multiple sugar transport system substrate-binding protein